MKKENKETEILMAAEKLFAEKGFKNATTTLIASEAGVTHAMLHYYFRTKDQIFLKVFDSYVCEVWNSLKAIMVPEFYDVEVVRKVTEIFFDFFSTHKGQASLFMEVARDRPDLLQTYTSQFGRYMGSMVSAHRERTERAVKEGLIKEIDFSNLFLDIIMVCTAPLFFEPVVVNLGKKDSRQMKEFMETRKKEAVEMIAGRLQINALR